MHATNDLSTPIATESRPSEPRCQLDLKSVTSGPLCPARHGSFSAGSKAMPGGDRKTYVFKLFLDDLNEFARAAICASEADDYVPAGWLTRHSVDVQKQATGSRKL